MFSNIRSLVKNANQLVMNLCERNYDLVFLTESWLNSKNELGALLGVANGLYDGVRCDRSHKRGGGVLLLLKKTLVHNVIFKESIPDAYELLICDIFINSKCIRFMVVYRVPGNTSGLNRLMKTISDFSICSNPCILLGDFNLPSLYSQGNLCESTNNSQTFLSLILTHGFQQLVTSPTRGNAYLDLLFCNDTFLIRNVQIGAPIGGSDHSTVIFDLNLLVLPEIFEYKRDFKNADYSAILEHLANIDWLGSFNMTNTVNEMYETFLAILHHVIELFVPIRKVKLAQLSLPKYLQRMLNHRTLLWKNAVLKQDANSWDKFKEANLRTEKAMNRYNVYLEKKLIESEDKTKFYRYVKFRRGNRSSIPCLKNESGEDVIQDGYKAEILAKVFQKSFNKQCREDFVYSEISPSANPVMGPTLWFHRNEIMELLERWPNSLSTTPDFIPFPFIKKVTPFIGFPLEYIFNLSYMRGIVPDRWRHALVTPIPKKPPMNDPKNYRPVSITSIFARLFEKIMKKRILKHLEQYDVIPRSQFGFLNNKSVETALLTSLNDWTKAIESKSRVDVVYFDFAKAFDKVPHAKLMKKLRIVGLHPLVIAWIENFLSNRTFQVRVGKEYSSVHQAYSGVPQGAVLSPLLFLIYTYDIPKDILALEVTCKMYADDIKIYKTIKSTADTERLQTAIEVINRWSNSWELPLAIEKTHVLSIGNCPADVTYYIGDVKLENVEEVRDLGYTINSNLDFGQHYKNLVNKAMGITYNMFKILKTKDVNVLIRAYKTYIRPIMESGTTVFNPYKQKDIDLLESVQNNFTRKVFIRCSGIDYSSIPNSTERSKQLGLPTLRSRRTKNDLVMMYKILTGTIDIDAAEFFMFAPRTTSRSGGLRLPESVAKSQIRSKFFSHRTIGLFTPLLRDGVLNMSVNRFKLYLDHRLKAQQ
ncbi:hypothetical protein Y032_0010g946 [Ancylostoma ceylanicum]|uniref:Reverse transcriptase domain-containing protein n=1 Tax=Ancylostoma ceylanicum TaxID=53326 RepID=A0A016VI96_9BILA|nr:hypothetical protein Y032_0010g946 [Ancylostoma ceylanicum]